MILGKEEAMRNIRLVIGVSIALLAILATVALGTAIGASAQSFDPNHRTFSARLSGSQEVPPVATSGTGIAHFKLSEDGNALYYTLIVENLQDVLFAHIHVAPRGQNGPIVLPLSGARAGAVNGVLASGTVTAADLTGPLAGKTLGDLVVEMQQDRTYTNVHTRAYPGGEIRGQNRFVPIDE